MMMLMMMVIYLAILSFNLENIILDISKILSSTSVSPLS